MIHLKTRIADQLFHISALKITVRVSAATIGQYEGPVDKGERVNRPKGVFQIIRFKLILGNVAACIG
jgi:hypothetical protein